MRLAREMRDDVRAAKRMRLPWWGVLCAIIGGVPIALLFDHFGRFDLSLPSLLSIGTIGWVIALKREPRRHLWFWITMTVIVAIHVLLILSVHWTTRWVPAPLLVPFFAVDVCAMLAIISVVGEFVERSQAANR